MGGGVKGCTNRKSSQDTIHKKNSHFRHHEIFPTNQSLSKSRYFFSFVMISSINHLWNENKFLFVYKSQNQFNHNFFKKYF